MPTYEYRCQSGHEFEKFFRSITAGQGEVRCPECGALAERQISGGAGLLFKGSGFYLTDYGKNAHRKGGAAGSSSPTTGASESGSKADGAASSTGGEAAKPSADSSAPAAPAPAPKAGDS